MKYVYQKKLEYEGIGNLIILTMSLVCMNWNGICKKNLNLYVGFIEYYSGVGVEVVVASMVAMALAAMTLMAVAMAVVVFTTVVVTEDVGGGEGVRRQW